MTCGPTLVLRFKELQCSADHSKLVILSIKSEYQSSSSTRSFTNTEKYVMSYLQTPERVDVSPHGQRVVTLLCCQQLDHSLCSALRIEQFQVWCRLGHCAPAKQSSKDPCTSQNIKIVMTLVPCFLGDLDLCTKTNTSSEKHVFALVKSTTHC